MMLHYTPTSMRSVSYYQAASPILNNIK